MILKNERDLQWAVKTRDALAAALTSLEELGLNHKDFIHRLAIASLQGHIKSIDEDIEAYLKARFASPINRDMGYN